MLIIGVGTVGGSKPRFIEISVGLSGDLSM